MCWWYGKKEREEGNGGTIMALRRGKTQKKEKRKGEIYVRYIYENFHLKGGFNLG